MIVKTMRNVNKEEKISNKFYKIARPDGWDFYTSKTINYRDNIGKTVRCPAKGRVKLCSSTAIHASRDPNQCFVGGSIPCSVYLVVGKPYAEDSDKCGFKQLRVSKELNPEKVFKWRYKEACNPIHPFKIKPPKKITKEHLKLLKQLASVRASVGASVGDSVWASVGDSVGDSVWASVGDSVWASVWASVGDSVWDSVWAYVGSLFPNIKKWGHIEHNKGMYPFQPAVDLWKMGLIPSFDGKVWRIHSGENAEILWEGKV